MLKAIIFDMDDTLYPEQQYVLSGFRAVAEWLEGKVGISSENAYQYLLELFNNDVRGNTFDIFLAEHGLEHPGFIRKMIRVYREHDPVLDLFPEVQEVLKYLEQYFILGLISDGYLDVQQRKLAALKIASFFKAIVFSDTWGKKNWKPSHKPYIEMMALCGTDASGMIYIGDNPTKDFLGARQLGIRTVMISRDAGIYKSILPSSPDHAPDMVIKNMTQLLDIVENG